MSTLIWLIASPVYFTISLGAGVDPLTGLLCAWIGVMTATGSAGHLIAEKRSIGASDAHNLSSAEVPQRFRNSSA